MGIVAGIKSLLAHPLTRELATDDPRLTELRREIIKGNRFLAKIYVEWYRFLLSCVPDRSRKVLELGSGGGFIKEISQDIITSEVLPINGVDMSVDATQLPFDDCELDGVIMIDVLHHIPAVDRFFREAERCLRPGGVIAMIEPWNTAWARLIYKGLHSEPFLPNAVDWAFPATGPLSSANGALPWIVFARDRKIFERNHPKLSVAKIMPDYPLSYLVSGGVSMRQLLPGWSYPVVRVIEKLLSPLNPHIGMFAKIVCRRT